MDIQKTHKCFDDAINIIREQNDDNKPLLLIFFCNKKVLFSKCSSTSQTQVFAVDTWTKVQKKSPSYSDIQETQ